MTEKSTRTEQEVFADLAAICCQPGYVHAIAHICFRDNVILHAGDMKEADMRKMFSPSRLIRTEINTGRTPFEVFFGKTVHYTKPPLSAALRTND